VPISRCNFQFNPQEIRQNVAMREDMYLPILQDVAQLQQPVGAVVNFTFDLLFDRSHELSKGRKTGEGWLGYSQADEENVDPLNPNPDKDAYDIGVMADLRILFSVIGQGFSREMLEFQKNRLKTTADRINQSNNGDTTTTEGGDVSAGADQQTSLGPIDDAALNEILEANYGNWGLLMPNPVRVMFSSLFMLDGFITGTNVDFLKFNTKMVPLMCRVTMNMSALYIGFARQDTFLTKQFKNAAEAQREQNEENQALRSEILKALTTTGNKFAVSTAWSNISDSKGWDLSIRSGVEKLPVWAMVVNDEAAKSNTNNERAIFLGFPNVVPREGEGRDDDYILRLYEEGVQFNISYSWNISIYGGIFQSSSLSQQQANTLISNKTYTSEANARLLGKYSGTESASSKKDWGSGASSDGAKAERVRRRSIRKNDKARNEATAAYPVHQYLSRNDIPEWLKNAYYVVDISVEISVTYGTANDTISISRNSIQALQGTSSVRKEFIINWNTGENSDTPLTMSDFPEINFGIG
jgi:hypothetical protein